MKYCRILRSDSVTTNLAMPELVVLLVEDEAAVRDVAAEHLTGLGYRVSVFGSGIEAAAGQVLVHFDEASTEAEIDAVMRAVQELGGRPALDRLADETRVLTGHGDATTIGAERPNV